MCLCTCSVCVPYLVCVHALATTDAHNPLAERRLSKSDFVAMNHSSASAEEGGMMVPVLPVQQLEEIYDRCVACANVLFVRVCCVGQGGKRFTRRLKSRQKRVLAARQASRTAWCKPHAKSEPCCAFATRLQGCARGDPCAGRNQEQQFLGEQAHIF